MLDTSLVDALRQQLRLSDLIVANFSPELLPEIVAWQATQSNIVELGNDFPVTMAKMYYASPTQSAFIAPKDVFAFIDPAGGGSDEIGIGAACAVGPYIHVLDVVGIRGGLNDENEVKICDFMRRNKVNRIRVESNMGHGLFEINLRAVLNKHDDLKHLALAVTGEYSTGQKERRIIDSMVSAMQRHRVVVHQRVFDSDVECGKQHGHEQRTSYSLWYQMANITTDRNSLPHDDRLEAMAGAVREFKHVLDQDEHKAAAARVEALQSEFMRDPMGYGNSSDNSGRGTRRVLDRRARRR
jgi:hypothetical protein